MRALLLSGALLIFTFGLVMIFSTTSADVLDHSYSDDYSLREHLPLIKQILFALLGSILSFGIYKLGWKRIFEATPLIMNITLILLVLTLIPGIGKVVNGSRRWLSVLGVSFQPSEFAKFVVPLFFLYYWRYYEKAGVDFKGFLKLLTRTLIPIVLILIEPNNGTALVALTALVILFFLVDVPLKFWALPLTVLMCLGIVFASQLPYVVKRIQVYRHPELDIQGKGHQPYQAKIATGSGGLMGKGPAKSLQKLSYLPEAQNDYIAAIFAEEFGFIGVFGLIGLYMLIALSGMSISMNATQKEGAIIAAMATFLITFQAFLNLGVVSGLLPSTGLNLPLFSQGGTSLIANFVEVAFIFSVGESS